MLIEPREAGLWYGCGSSHASSMHMPPSHQRWRECGSQAWWIRDSLGERCSSHANRAVHEAPHATTPSSARVCVPGEGAAGKREDTSRCKPHLIDNDTRGCIYMQVKLGGECGTAKRVGSGNNENSGVRGGKTVRTSRLAPKGLAVDEEQRKRQ